MNTKVIIIVNILYSATINFCKLFVEFNFSAIFG